MGHFVNALEEHKFNCDGVGAIFQVLQSDTVSIFGEAWAALCVRGNPILQTGLQYTAMQPKHWVARVALCVRAHPLPHPRAS